MTTTTTVRIGPLTRADLASADRIFRLAFGTFLGLPDPRTTFGDSDYVATRWRADPTAALAASIDGELVGSNFVTVWGSVGVFGPLTVRPDLWDQGIAKQLMEPTVSMLDERGVRLACLFTFAHSAKHVGLYQRFGFWPQQLTAIFARSIPAHRTRRGWSVLSEATDRNAVTSACQEIAVRWPRREP